MKLCLKYAKSKINVFILLIFISLVGAFVLSGFTENVFEVSVIAVYKKIFGGRDGQKKFDSSGILIIICDYEDGIYIGKQRNPVYISSAALSCFKNHRISLRYGSDN